MGTQIVRNVSVTWRRSFINAAIRSSIALMLWAGDPVRRGLRYGSRCRKSSPMMLRLVMLIVSILCINRPLMMKPRPTPIQLRRPSPGERPDNHFLHLEKLMCAPTHKEVGARQNDAAARMAESPIFLPFSFLPIRVCRL